jgi:hypothetical protein
MALLFFVFMWAISPMTSPATAQGADQDPWFKERDAGPAPDFSQIPYTNQAPTSNVQVGVQLIDALDAGVGAYDRWRTYNWPARWHIIWTVMPTSASLVEGQVPQINWIVEIERTPNDLVAYWITITNMSQEIVSYELRYAILNPLD